MLTHLFRATVAILACLGLTPGSHAQPEAARWRTFFRETRFDRLLLDLAERYKPQTIVIRGATILSMNDAPPLQDGAIVIADGRITQVGRSSDVQTPAGARVVDAAGRWLVPGLVDSHMHTSTSSAHHLLNLVNGVTTVREMCGFPWMLKLRDRVRQNRILVPNMYLAGPLLNHFEMEFYAVVVQEPDLARELVREHKAAGYDFIKVHNVLRPACYDAILDEARKQGIDVVGHIPQQVTVAKAIAEGQRTFEHFKGYILDRTLEMTTEDYVAATRGAEVWNCPTLYTYRIGLRSEEVRSLLTREEAQYISSDERAVWIAAAAVADGEAHRKVFEMSSRIFRDLLPINARFLAGTDSGGGYPMMVPGFALHEEMRLMAELGLPAPEVLRAATINAAAAMRREHEFGTLAPGRRADLLVLNRNPLESVANLGAIDAVVVRGILLDRTALDSLKDSLRKICADEPVLDSPTGPSAEQMDGLVASIVELHRAGFVAMDHHLKQLAALLTKNGRPVDAINALREENSRR